MVTSDLPRRIKPCKHCRAARAACCVGPSEESCVRCEQKGLACSPNVNYSSRDVNDRSELRSQLARFEAVLNAIKKQAAERESSQEARTPASSDSGQSPQTPEPIEVHDLVGALTGLCFTADGVAGGPKGQLSQHDLVVEAVDMLAKEDLNSVAQLPTSGFTFKPLPPCATLRDLIDALPPAQQVVWLLDDVYRGKWTRGLDGLFYPLWRLRIQMLLDTGFRPPPPPAVLAELFACLAIGSSVVQTGRDLEAFPVERAKWQKQIDRYAELAQRALTLANYVADPCLESTRALCLLAELHLSCSSSTSRLARGLGILPVAISALGTLGFHVPEEDFDGLETPEEQYSRRALVCTLLRLDWESSYGFGKRAITDPRTWPVELPAEPRDEDLPPAARSNPFRQTPMLMRNMHSCFRIVQMQQEMLADVFGSAKVDYSAVCQYATKIDELWEELVLPRWSFYDDPTTGLRRWGDPAQPNQPAPDGGDGSLALPFDERCAKSNICAKMLKLVLALHRPFVHPEGTLAGSQIDFAWHRDVTLATCRSFTLCFLDAATFMASFCALVSYAFDALVGQCLLIYSNPDSPEVAKYRHELCIGIRSMINSPSAPSAVYKLGRIAAFLLDRPKLRQAEQNLERTSAPVEQKRVRKGRLGTGYDVFPQGRLPDSYLRGTTEQFNFSFETPALPKVTMPAVTQLQGSVEDDLWHKPSFATSNVPSVPATMPPPVISHAGNGLLAAATRLPSARQPPVELLGTGAHDARGGQGIARAYAGQLPTEHIQPTAAPVMLSTLGIGLARQGNLGSLMSGVSLPDFHGETVAPGLSPSLEGSVPSEGDDLDQWLRRLSG